MILSGPKAIITNRTVNTGGGSGPSSITTANIDVYVATTGSDSNPGTLALPFLTIQKAVDSIPRNIRHKVTINVGVGNFAGFLATGFNVMPSATWGTLYSWLYIKGTMSDVASVNGPSGTLTAFSAASGATNAVATDNLKTWAVNEFRGYYMEVTSGTGSTSTEALPARWMIVSNTATTLTLLGGALTAPAAASGYKIVTPGTIINSGTAAALSSGTPSQVAQPGNNLIFGAAFQNNVGSGYAVSNIQFTMSASMTRGILMQEHRLRVLQCRFIAASSSAIAVTFANTAVPNAAVFLFACHMDFTGSSNSQGVSCTTAGGASSMAAPSLVACYVRGGLIGYNQSGAAAGPIINGCKFENQTFSGLQLYGMTLGQITACRFDNCVTGISVTESSSQGIGPTAYGLTSSDISNCTAAGITIQGALSAAYLSTVSGSGNAIGLNISRGAKCVVASDVTMTGTPEVSIDAVASDYATMRAATPKLVSNASYLTMFYQ